jgi:hypothetical protein
MFYYSRLCFFFFFVLQDLLISYLIINSKSDWQKWKMKFDGKNSHRHKKKKFGTTPKKKFNTFKKTFFLSLDSLALSGHFSKMDQNTAYQLFVATYHPDPNVHKQAELNIRNVSFPPGVYFDPGN